MTARLVAFIDDSSAAQETIQALQAAGMSVRLFTRASEFLKSEVRESASCAVCKFNLPDVTGLELLRALRAEGNHLSIIFLAESATIKEVVLAMRAGAMNFLEKPVDVTDLIASINEAIEIRAKQRDKDQRRADARDRLAQLTSREHEVFDLVVAGLSSKEVAEKLFLSDKTVQLYRAMIAKKLQTRGLAEQIRLALLAEEPRN